MRVTARQLSAVDGSTVPVPAPDRLVHLQFRRFAGCPICNLHLRSIWKRHDELLAAGVNEVVVFHSSAAALRPFTAELPFPVIPDPGQALYREFGVGTSARSLLDPRVWPTMARAALGAIRHPPSLRIEGGRLGLPADFLIAPDGTVVASKRGVHASDQWSVDEILTAAAEPAG